VPNGVSGVVRALAGRVWPRRSSAAVLVYHRVAATTHDPFGQAVKPETFERQLRMLGDFGSLIPVGELVERMTHGRTVAGTIAVTFDDGYADNLEVAAPVTATLGVPITVFVTTQPVFAETPFWWDELPIASAEAGSPAIPNAPDADTVQQWHLTLRRESGARRAALLREITAVASYQRRADAGRPMTPDELRRLAALPGITIGAHTVTHPSLAALPADEQRREMAESRETLERFLGEPVRLLAYPFGKPPDVASETKALAQALGYAAAFTTVPLPLRPDADRFALPRLTVHEWPDDVFAETLEALVGRQQR